MCTCWTLTDDVFDVDNNCAWEGLLTQGNGYFHVRGSLEEHLANAPQNVDYMRMPGNVTAEEFPETKAKWGTYIPGIFGPHPLLGNEMINLPFFLGIKPAIDREPLDIEQLAPQITGYRRTLDLRTATLRRELTWTTESGKEIHLEFERFASAARPHFCVQKLTIKSDETCRLDITAGIDADVRTNGYDHFETVNLHPIAHHGVCCELTTDGGDDVTIVSHMRSKAGDWNFQAGQREATRESTFTLSPNSPLVIEKRTALSTSRDRGDMPHPHSLLQQISSSTWDDLHEEHCAVWEDLWDRSDVCVEGDPDSQLALRTSLYHLLRAHPRSDSRVSIDAKGYAGEAYWGRFFWDTDLYIMPFYLYTHPKWARTLVDFRVNTLPGARENADSYGYSGARYAWESDHEGQECCPSWQYRDHEVHVTADVVYGMAHFARAGNADYLHGDAAEVLVETARYWMERVDTRDGDSYPSILGVMGPDEYAPLSHNNSYTNRLVSFALNAAAQYGKHADASAEERRRFRETADGLRILRDESRSGAPLVVQSEDFDMLAEPPFDMWTDRSKPCAADVSQERIYRSKCLKQPDVLLLMLLFPNEFTSEEWEKAWDYYVPLTTHDSSLSPGIHSVVASRIGNDQQAWNFWTQSRDIDLDIEHGAVAQGIHIACAANNWRVAVMGFGGVRSVMESETLTIAPQLPEKWDALSFPLVWKGAPIHVTIRNDQLTVANDGDAELPAVLADEKVNIPAGEECTVSLDAED